MSRLVPSVPGVPRPLTALSCSLAVAVALTACVDMSLNRNEDDWLGGQSATAPPAKAPETPPLAERAAPPPPAEAAPAPRAAPPPPQVAVLSPAAPRPFAPSEARAPEPQEELEDVERVPLTPPAEVGPQPVRVGILLPLSGPNAGLGSILLDAAQLALFELDDGRVELLPRDTRGTPEGAATAAQDALASGAQLLIGPLFSASVAAAAPVARASGVNIVAFSTDRAVAGRGVFLMGFMPEQQVDRVVAYALAKGLERFAALVPDSPYGATVVRALNAAVAQQGGRVVQVELYAADASDAHDPVKRLAHYERRRAALAALRKRLAARDDEVSKQALERIAHLETIGELDYDVVMLPDGGATLRAVAPLLPYYDIDPAKVKFLGTGLWDDPSLGTEPALVGGWFPAPPLDTTGALERRYAAAYGRKPPRIASLAYDAVALAAVLAREDQGPDFSAGALTDPSGFAGTGGLFRFRPNGVVERGLAVLEVEPRGLKVVDEAPRSFEKLAF